MSQSVYATDDTSIETNRRGALPFTLIVQTNSTGNLNRRRHSGHCLGRCFVGVVRRIVLKCFDIFKHLRLGLKSVDEIKKRCRDIPREILPLILAIGMRRPRSVKTPSANPPGIPYYRIGLFDAHSVM